MKRAFIAVLSFLLVSSAPGKPMRMFGVKAGAELASQTWSYAPPFNSLETESRWGADEVKPLGSLTLGMEFRYSPSLRDAYSSPFITVRNSSLEFLLVAGF